MLTILDILRQKDRRTSITVELTKLVRSSLRREANRGTTALDGTGSYAPRCNDP